MRKIILLCLCLSLAAVCCGCRTIGKIAGPAAAKEQQPADSPFAAYSGARARIAVADFDIRTVKATGDAARGLRQMFIVALAHSNRFEILERQQGERQEKPAASGAPNSGAEQPKAYEAIVTATIDEFDPQTSGGAAGVGGGGGSGSGIFGGLLGATLNKARMSLDIRITDAATNELLASGRVQGQASDAAIGFLAGFFGSWPLGEGLGVYANTPMEKAVRLCIIEAGQFMAQAMPREYYKY